LRHGRAKEAIDLHAPLDAEIVAAAGRAGVTYSSWLAATARKEFTIRASLAAVSEFEEEHGAFTPQELAGAEQWAARASDQGPGPADQQRSA
jgi:hypothetical protein